MNTLREFVEYKLTHSDNTSEAEGYPLVMENCKKNKRMKQLEVYGNCFQDGTPTPENPIEVQCVGEKSRNLFDISKSIKDYGGLEATINADGSYNLRGNIAVTFCYFTSYKLETPIPNGTVITLSSHFDTVHAGQYVGIFVGGESGNIVFQANRAYNGYTMTLRCEEDIHSLGMVWASTESSVGDYIEINNIKLQLEIGSAATDIIPYGKYKVPIVQRGKNLCTPCVPIITTNSTYADGVVTQKTADADTNPYFKVNALFLDGTVKMLTTTSVPPLGTRGILKFTLTNDVQYLIFGLNGSKQDTMIRIQKIPIGTYVFSFKILNNVQGSFSWCDMQIEPYEEGVTPTEFEPYVEPITTNIYLDEPLRKCSGWGYVVGSVRSVDCIDARNKKLYRFNHEYYLDGSRSVTKYSDSVYLIQMGAPRCMNVGSAAVSNHFPHGVHYNSIATIQMSNAIGSQIQITNPTLIDGVTDTETLKQWFAENPTTFIQPLETPIVEDLNIELPKLNAKTTIIEVDTSLAPSNISGKYIIR